MPGRRSLARSKRRERIRVGVACSSNRRRRLLSRGKKLFQRGAHFWNVDGRDLPHDVQIHVRVIVRDNVTHAAHSAERQFRDGLPRSLAQMDCGFANDFDAPHHGILLLRVGAEIGFSGVADVAGNESGCLQNITQPPELVSFHKRAQRWTECVRARSGWAISPGRIAAQNLPARPQLPQLRLPSPATRPSKRALGHRASPASPRHCLAWRHRARPSRRFPGGGWDAFRRTVAADSAIQPVRAFRDSCARGGTITDNASDENPKRNNDHETNQPENTEPRPFRESAGHQRAPARARIGPRSYGQSPRNLRNFIFPKFSLAGSRVVDRACLERKAEDKETKTKQPTIMLQLLFRKWWVVLLQGILLIILSIYIFQNPVEVLAGISLWFGLLVLAAGVLGIIAWLAADKQEREGMSLFWSILTAAFGLLMLLHLLVTMKTLTVIFGLWMLVTGLLLVQSGWSLRSKNSFGWIMVIAGVLSAVAAVMVVFNIGTGAIGISTLFGLQVLLTGIALILLSFTKKIVAGRIKDKIESLKSGLQ